MSHQERIKKSTGSQTYFWFVWSGVVGAIVGSIFVPFTVKFLERIGGTDFHISLLNSLPGIVGMSVSLPGALWLAGNKGKNLKTLTVEFTLVSRLMVLLLIPLVWISPQWAPLFCVGMLALKNIPEAISQTAFQGLTGDLFRPEDRSTAITQRNRYGVPAMLAVSLAAGIAMRVLPGNDAERLTIYQIFFVLAALFGVLEVGFMSRMQETGRSLQETSPPWRDMVRQVSGNKQFLKYMSSSLVFYFSWQMGWPLFSIYQVIHLGADELWLSLIGVMSSIGMFIGFRFWNRIIQRHGNGRTAVLVVLGMSTNPILLVIFPNLYWVTGINVLIGFFTAGTITVLLNALLEVTPQEHRVVYVGTYNMFVNASLAVSPIVAFAILRGIGIIPALITVSLCRLAGCLSFWLYNRHAPRLPA